MLNVSCSREQPLPQRILYFSLRANTEKKEELYCPFTDGVLAERDELACNDHLGNLWQKLRHNLNSLCCHSLTLTSVSSSSSAGGGLFIFLCAKKISESVQIYQILLTNSNISYKDWNTKDCEQSYSSYFFFFIPVSFLPYVLHLSWVDVLIKVLVWWFHSTSN